MYILCDVFNLTYIITIDWFTPRCAPSLRIATIKAKTIHDG